MSVLFELDDFTETRTAWQIVTDWGRCGLCGIQTVFNQGGTSVGGEICDKCAETDRCNADHVSYWGIRHDVGDHARLVDEQRKRRARYLARIEAVTS